MKNVYAFTYDSIHEPAEHPGRAKHLVAVSVAEATKFAKQFLIDDGLNKVDEEPEWEITGVSRKMVLDWPMEHSPDPTPAEPR